MIREILETKSIIYIRSSEWETLYVDGMRTSASQMLTGSDLIDIIVNTDAELNKHNFAVIFDETGIMDDFTYECNHVVELISLIEEREDIRLESSRHFGHYTLVEI